MAREVTAAPGDAPKDGWFARIEALCSSRGLQMTALRRQITGIIARAPGPLTAYAIIDALGREQDKPIGPPTVYRTLDFLTEHGFVVKIASRNAYARCDHPGHHHHGALLICVRCGRLDEIDSHPLDDALREVAQTARFAVLRQGVELEGVCAACAPAVPG